jgi:hypothetical protein
MSRLALVTDTKKKSLLTRTSSAAYTIFTFVRKALSNQLLCSLSNPEISECIYLARLLYSHCQGAYLIKEFDIGKLMSESWRSV